MKIRYIALVAAASLFSAVALAQSGYSGPGGDAPVAQPAARGYVGPGNAPAHHPNARGYVGPGAANIATTAAAALQAADDTPAVLQGNIVRRIKKERYEFQDATGTVQVEIDDDDWPPQPVSEKTVVKLTGEVDRNWRGVEVDVDFVEIVRP